MESSTDNTLPVVQVDRFAHRYSSKECPECAGKVAIDSSHVRIAKGSIQVFCTHECLRNYDIPRAPIELPRLAPTKKMHVLVVGLGFSFLSPCSVLKQTPVTRPRPVVADVPHQDVLDFDGPQYGPNLPTPEELAKEIAEEFAASLGVSAWLHPLSGPTRRMPLRESRAFGADRPGHRPHECRSGHCGVDLGGAVWGEPILASSDGVAFRVNRDASRSGGKYVRLSHQDGTVFTQYFHLAAIPKWLRKGKSVRAGQTIGLLGETGVENSGPHLHYSVSIKADAEQPEVYIDPEPLIALWPLRQRESLRAIASGPGVPIGATGKYKSRKGKRKRPSSRAASSQETGSPVQPSYGTGSTAQPSQSEPAPLTIDDSP